MDPLAYSNGAYYTPIFASPPSFLPTDSRNRTPTLYLLYITHAHTNTPRFEQVKPKVIFAVDAVVYNAKVHPHLPKLASLLSGLQASSSSSSSSTPIKPTVILISPLPSSLTSGLPPLESLGYEDVVAFEEFRKRGEEAGEKGLGRRMKGEVEIEIEWRRMGFDWPLWVLFSSGTTGTSWRLVPLPSLFHLPAYLPSFYRSASFYVNVCDV